MSRLATTRETLIALFAKSGNVCAFPGCTHELVTSRSLFVGQICHIEAANPGGQRFNPCSTDEERRAFGNLMLLCYKHHRETDDVQIFDAQKLKDMKHQHELMYGDKPFKVDEAFLYQLESEMSQYWKNVVAANTTEHQFPEFAVPIKLSADAKSLFSEINDSVRRLGELLGSFAESDSTLNEEIQSHLTSLGYDLQKYDAVPYYKNPFINRNWETHSLLANNSMINLVVALKQAEVRFLEEYAKTHSGNTEALRCLAAAKDELLKMAVSAGYAD